MGEGISQSTSDRLQTIKSLAASSGNGQIIVLGRPAPLFAYDKA
jgi:hypothetical protein